MNIQKRTLNGLCLSASLGFFVGTIGFLEANDVVAAEGETPKEIIADQIRCQGFSCKDPQDATRDPEHTKPDEAAWVLTCENVTYRVILIPDMAARVEQLK
jgi:hypothetical protein